MGIYALSTEGGRQIFKTARQIHLDERLLHAALPAAIPLDDGGLEGHALESGDVERNVAGGREMIRPIVLIIYRVPRKPS